ncbi:hypothetical protein AB0F81_48395 [Actinoplanes sp. NPDC024001]|uniref:hypothetical protein n=1 Tax=Actinoplanes sp. NPDC024001 TaxID=3154598 RepID=UPI00340BBA9C
MEGGQPAVPIGAWIASLVFDVTVVVAYAIGFFWRTATSDAAGGEPVGWAS